MGLLKNKLVYSFFGFVFLWVLPSVIFFVLSKYVPNLSIIFGGYPLALLVNALFFLGLCVVYVLISSKLLGGLKTGLMMLVYSFIWAVGLVVLTLGIGLVAIFLITNNGTA